MSPLFLTHPSHEIPLLRVRKRGIARSPAESARKVEIPGGSARAGDQHADQKTPFRLASILVVYKGHRTLLSTDSSGGVTILLVHRWSRRGVLYKGKEPAEAQ